MVKEQDLNRIKQTYDIVAKEYAQEFFGEHEKKPKDQEILHRYAQEIGDRRPVWDLGCGPGQTTAYLKNLGVEIAGLDLSEKTVEQAKIVHPEIHFQKGNMLELDFTESSIAGIVSFYAIVHFTSAQVKKAFREIFRVLQSGGLFLFTYHIGDETVHMDEYLGKSVDIDIMFFPTDFVADSLRAVGFEHIEIIEREPYTGVEYESRRAYVFATANPIDSIRNE
jgi:ubiquinone/menaquinone biosynthesis C-methylase UbiE